MRKADGLCVSRITSLRRRNWLMASIVCRSASGSITFEERIEAALYGIL